MSCVHCLGSNRQNPRRKMASGDIYVKTLAEFAGDSKRLEELQRSFHTEFEDEPDFFVIVPGRVNLIGEHVDYCGYPVLPMAVEQNIMVAVKKTDDGLLNLKNINPKYTNILTDINQFDIRLPDKGGPAWHNYFLCGVKGIADALFESIKSSVLIGMRVLVAGNIPPASGLSSSSALVSAAALATSYINQFTMEKHMLSSIAATCERYIGTQGGGMDQAIAFLAQRGCAQFIEWDPLRATPVNLPDGAVFVIANSLAEANKAATSDFNHRVVECRMACSIMAKCSGLNWREYNRFATLQHVLGLNLDQFEQLAKASLDKRIYKRNTLLDVFEITDSELEQQFLSTNTKHLEVFKLRQRALHVIQESIRVVRFKEIAQKNGTILELGELMRQSHASLQTQFECSHPKLNELVAISDEFNVDARLTGAGWGGCMVALCDSKESSIKYIQKLKDCYYKGLALGDINMDTVVFATNPQNGAEIILNK